MTRLAKTEAIAQRAYFTPRNSAAAGPRLISAEQSREADLDGTPRGHSWPVVLFLVALAVPWIFYFGPLRMSAYRTFLCLALLPCLLHWVKGYAGQIRAADISIILFACWKGVSLLVLHGTAGLQPVGISFVETLGPYFLARCCIRNADDFQAIVKVLFVVIAALLPLALIEAFTGWKATLRIFGMLLPTYPEDPMSPRAGLWRVQGPFEHSILFGVVCGTGFALVFLVLGYRKPLLEKYGKAGIVALTATLSLSAGPLLGMALQCLLILWKRLADATSLKLVWLVTVSFVSMVQFTGWITHRSPIEVIVSRLTFDSMSYWSRNLIWEYGWLSVSNHPWLGTGYGRWDRPHWMVDSIDNFWLGTAVVYGLPGLFLIGGSVAICFASVGLKRGLDERHRAYRAAYLIVTVSWCLVGQTVHLWDGPYVLVIFLLGSGIWLLDVASPSTLRSCNPGRARNEPLHQRKTAATERSAYADEKSGRKQFRRKAGTRPARRLDALRGVQQKGESIGNADNCDA